MIEDFQKLAEYLDTIPADHKLEHDQVLFDEGLVEWEGWKIVLSERGKLFEKWVKDHPKK